MSDSLLEDAAGSVKRSQGVLDNVVTLERAAESKNTLTLMLCWKLIRASRTYVIHGEIAARYAALLVS